MRLIANFARILIGLEFIFSGFVKVVDPYGTGLKLQEYFEVFANDLPPLSGLFDLFAHSSQFLSLVFCAGELILGVALLINYKMPKTAWIVLGMMLFFTFLTFYSAFFDRVTDCGCFGDFLKLKPWDSFKKDVISLFFILIIFFNRKNYNEFKYSGIVTGIATLIAFGIGIYSKIYLPVLDFLPYAKGLSIPEQMKPTGVKPIINYTFLDKESNKEISSAEYLMDTNKYKYQDSKILNENELRPKITDYSLSDTAGNDVTTDSFEGSKLLIIFKKTEELNKTQIDNIKKLALDSDEQGIENMTLTSLITSEFDPFFKGSGLPGSYFTIDEKVLKTMARTNPCLILLENGVVKGKWSSHNIPDVSTVKELLNK